MKVRISLDDGAHCNVAGERTQAQLYGYLQTKTNPWLPFLEVSRSCCWTALTVRVTKPIGATICLIQSWSTIIKKAAEHHEHAAKYHYEAARHHENGHHEKAAHHAHIAHSHKLHAEDHAEHAAKAHHEAHG